MMDKGLELKNVQNEITENCYNTLKDTNHVNIQRPIYQLEDLNRDHFYEKPYKSLTRRCKEKIHKIEPVRCIQQTLPVLKWLPNYKWKQNILSDIISGITVAIMHIPQGMAYGLLGGVPPVVGIYMAFFPVLVYFLFGTSRHVSIGTFAIVCLMTGKVVSEYSTVEILQNGTIVATSLPSNNNNDNNLSNTTLYLTNVNVACTVTFTVALIQLLMYFLRFGIVSTLLSETLVNGFTCASAFHIVSSQLKDLFGLKTHKVRGNFSFFITIYNSIFAIPEANYYACCISFITCTLLILNNALFKPWLSKKTRYPCPIELVAVILGTSISKLFNLNYNYDITVVGHIPTGLPIPEMPTFWLIPDILLDAFVITMVSYTITMSMALIFARKLMYEIDSNQELLALGLSNTVGSFFSCMPITASLSRSMIQQSVGGVTQLASIVSCSLLLIILLWIGPFFETLPRCVLASIIVVALKAMLFQCTSIIKYWKLNKWDATVWIVTFCTTLILQIGIGLAAGVAISLISVFIQGYKPYTCLLGLIPNTDLYVDIKRYKGACELDGIKIFHYSGGLSFASRTAFKDSLSRKTGFDAAQVLRKRLKIEESSSIDDINGQLLVKAIILDFSAVTFIDPSGVELLRQLQNDYNKLDILLLITNCSSPVYEVFKKCDLFDNIESKFLIFPTIHDAVLYSCQLRKNNIDDNDNSQLIFKKNHHHD